MHEEVRSLFDLTRKVAVVTGGARDLGWDAASILAAAGCDVAITSRDGTRADASAARLKALYGVETLALAMDQAVFAEVERAAQAVVEWKGRVDVLINNAGGGSGDSPGNLFLRTPEDSARLIEVNLTGALYCCREFGRPMERQGSGKIVNIASIAGMVGRDRRMYDRSAMKGQPIDYAAAKAGVIGMTRDLAGFFGPKGVCVNAISPGGFSRGQAETFIEDYSDATALGRMGRDGIDLKGAILFLASPASDYVTGVNLPVDGGFTMWK